MRIHPQKRKSQAKTVECFSRNLTIKDQREAELIKITNSLNLAQEIAKIGSWDYDVENNTMYCSDPLYPTLLKKAVRTFGIVFFLMKRGKMNGNVEWLLLEIDKYKGEYYADF